MATPAAVLSVLVSANTDEATLKLSKFDKQIVAMNDMAKKGIETRLGATYDPRAMDAYNAKLDELAKKAHDRAAFKAELGANFSNAGFAAYERAVKESTAATRAAETETTTLSERFGAAAKSALAFGAAYIGFGAAKSAIDNTETLGENVLKLHSAFGLSIKDATAWGAQIQARGADSKSLLTSFKTLSNQVLQAAEGSKTAERAFADLGISQRELSRNGNDLQWVLSRVSDGIARLPAGTQRGADAGKLLGRTYAQLMPLLSQGSAAMERQLGLVSQFGVQFTGGAKGIEQMREKQIELSIAGIGLQTTFTEQVAPALLSFATKVIKLINDLRPFKSEIEGIAAAIALAWGASKLKIVGDFASALITRVGGAFKKVAADSVVTAGVVKSSDAAMAASTTEAAGIMDTAIGSTGLGLLIIGLGLGITELAQHWKTVWHGIESVTQGVVSGIKTAVNELITLIDDAIHLYNKIPGFAKTVTGLPQHINTINHLNTTFAGEYGPGPDAIRQAIGIHERARRATGSGSDAAGAGRGINQANLPVNPKLIQAAVLAIQTARVTDTTKSQTDAAQARQTVIADMQTLASQQLQAAAKNLTDAAGVVSAKLTAAATAITDAATVRHDQSQILLQGLQDATQTQTDLLGERGLQGFQLLAQKLQVQEDIQKQGFDHQIAVQQKVVDQVKAAWDGKISADAIRVAMVTQHQDHLSALAQQKATQTQLHADTVLANATAKSDMIQLANDVNTALAQQAVTLAAGGSQVKQRAAAAALTLAQGRAGQSNALAAQHLGLVTASTTAATNTANQQYQKVQDVAAYAIAQAQSKQARDTGLAQRAEALSNAKLQRIQDQAAVALQQMTDQVNLVKSVGGFYYVRSSADRSNQNRGGGPSASHFKGGLTINGLNIYSHDKKDAQIADQIWLKLRPLLNRAA